MFRRQSHYILNHHKAFIMSFLAHNNDSLIKNGFHNFPQLPSTFSRIRSLSFNNGISSNVSNCSFGFRIRSCSDSQNLFSNDQRAAHSYTVPHRQLVYDLETRLEDRASSSNDNCNSSISSANHGSYINGNGKALGFPPANYPLTSNLVVAVDVDEVLGNFVSALNRFIADRYSSNHSVSEYHVYEFFKIWKCSRDEADVRVHEFFKTPYFKSGIYPLPGAQKVLNKMARVCKLSVVTSRQNVIKDHTIEWIERHYPGVFEEIHFGNHFALHGESRPKSEICRDLGATVLIDDNPRYAIECAEVGIKVLLFDYENSYPWCKSDSVNHPLVTKVHNWEQVEQQLISLVS